MTMTKANPLWLGIADVAVLAVDASNYGASIETGNVFVPKTPELFTYDADGNMLSDGRWNYTWDAENRLLRVQSRSDTPQGSWRRVEWQYDVMGRRTRQISSDGSSGTWQVTEDLTFVSDPLLFGRHIAELRAPDNALVRSYVWGLDLSGTMDGAGGVGGLLWVTLHTASGAAPGTHFCAYDGNGNIVALSAASDGSATARYEYGPFGEPIRVTGPAAPPESLPLLDQAHRQHHRPGGLRIPRLQPQLWPLAEQGSAWTGWGGKHMCIYCGLREPLCGPF